MAAAWVQFAPRQGRELVPAFLELVNALFSVFLLLMAYWMVGGWSLVGDVGDVV